MDDLIFQKNIYFLIFLSSIIISIISIPFINKLALKFNLFDYPDERKIHKSKLIRIGGLAIIIGSIIPILSIGIIQKNLSTEFLS